MLSLIIRVMAHDMPTKSSNPTPGSMVLFHNHCSKLSAPFHRHLACVCTASHSLRSLSALFGIQSFTLIFLYLHLPTHHSSPLNNIASPRLSRCCLPSAVYTTMAYRPKPMSICISLLYFLPKGRLPAICATRYSLIFIFQIFSVEF